MKRVLGVGRELVGQARLCTIFIRDASIDWIVDIQQSCHLSCRISQSDDIERRLVSDAPKKAISPTR